MKEQIVGSRERGASAVEYVMLVAGVALLTMASVSVLGPMVSGGFGDAGSALAFDDTSESTTTTTTAAPAKNGGCPNGWGATGAGQTKKNGKNVDANNDGVICRKVTRGNGRGNSNRSQNVKDNN